VVAVALCLLPALGLAAGRMAVMTQDTTRSAELGELAPEAVRLTPHMTVGGVFAVTVITVLWWLLAVPPQVSAVAAHAHRIVSAIRKIVVPVNMHSNWERAVELACRLGEDQKAEILLTYVIEIPFTLSLSAPMAKTEQTARETLERAQAIVEQHELPVRTQVERARQAGEGIARLARDEDADLIVMAAPMLGARLPGIQTRTIETLLHRAPCEVIIDSAPRRTEEPDLGTTQSSEPGEPPAAV
jgi:nucleotide-binding universal stress UspA family protein